MHLVFHLLQLAVKHTHTYQQWTKIWKMYIKKDTGSPKVNWLQTLHLVETDLNLLLKWFAPHGYYKCSKQHGCLHDVQGRG